MIPPNGFSKPDRVVKTYNFDSAELEIVQEIGDFGITWFASLTQSSGAIKFLTIFGRWTDDASLVGVFSSEKKLISILKKA